MSLVTMEDGREVKFTPKKQVLFNIDTDPNDPSAIQLNMAFSDGQYRTHTLDPALLSAYAAYGLRAYVKRLLGSSGCSLDFDASLEALGAGPFAARKRAPRTTTGPKPTPLEKALCVAFGKPLEATRSFLASKSRTEKFQIAADTRVAGLLAQYRAEEKAAALARKAASTGETQGDLLSGFALPTVTGELAAPLEAVDPT